MQLMYLSKQSYLTLIINGHKNHIMPKLMRKLQSEQCMIIEAILEIDFDFE